MQIRVDAVRDYFLPGLAVEGEMTITQAVEGLCYTGGWGWDDGSLGFEVEVLLRLLLEYEPGGQVVEPARLTSQQKRLLAEWLGERHADWSGTELQDFDSIPWRLCADWREHYGAIPRYRYADVEWENHRSKIVGDLPK